jgi:uncharacterized repeat protein (TIGR03803 family)
MKPSQLTIAALALALTATLHAQNYKVLVNFNGNPVEPIQPGLIAQSWGGYLLTTTPDYQTSDGGTAFRVSTSGDLTNLYQFSQAEGGLPASGLVLGRDGEFYGTTVFGGAHNGGTVFEMTPDGIVKDLHDFANDGNGYPQAPPIQSLYGDFYGTTNGSTSNPGASNPTPGTIYKINADGTGYTLLHTFNNVDGSNPVGPLVQATDFSFYGTANHGGPNNAGTIFRTDSSGNFQVLFNFDTTHGGYPQSMIQGNDGNFYGVTMLGGAGDQGTVFKMTPSFQVTVLHSFSGGSDGSQPLGNLIQASDGYLYGTTSQGGTDGVGVLFRISTSGDFAVLHTFVRSTGVGPIALIQHTDGFLYGDTNAGGSQNAGVFYRYDLGLPEFVSFLNCYGSIGETVQILGQNFTADSQVLFNGVPAQVTELEPNYLKATVPIGATTGWITVTTTKGVLQSNKIFIVRSPIT